MKTRRGFTLIEMLCVLVISGILLTLAGNAIAGSMTWSRTGFEESVISDQLDQALDYMEYDVRSAIDIDVEVTASSMGRTPSEVRSTTSLRLLTVDEGDPQAMGRIVYQLRSSSNEYNKENPKERPRPNHILYRGHEDSLRLSSKDQPLAMYLSSKSGLGEPLGMRVYYYGRDGARCSLAEEVYSVEIQLTGLTKERTAVTRSRRIPLNVKFE